MRPYRQSLSQGRFNSSALMILLFINSLVNFRLISLFWRTGGPLFGVLATFYYMLVYPLAVGVGTCSGFLSKQRLSVEKNYSW